MSKLSTCFIGHKTAAFEDANQQASPKLMSQAGSKTLARAALVSEEDTKKIPYQTFVAVRYGQAFASEQLGGST